MDQLSLFDYGALDPETRIVVQQRTGEIKSLMRRAAQDIVEIGLKLIEVKARLGHGGFLPWLEAEFEWSVDTAQRFMGVADRFGGKPQIAAFAPSALYLLSKPSTPDAAREEALALAEQGEPVTHAKAKEIVETHKPAPVGEVSQVAAPPVLFADDGVDVADEEVEDDDVEFVRAAEVVEPDIVPAQELMPPIPHPQTPTRPAVGASETVAVIVQPEGDQQASTQSQHTPSRPTPPPSRFPHSDHYIAWLEFVSSHGLVINHDHGGLTKMLGEREKWNRRDVKEYLLPLLTALHERIARDLEEIRNAFE